MILKHVFPFFVSLFLFTIPGSGQEKGGVLNKEEIRSIVIRLQELIKNNYIFASTATQAAEFLASRMEQEIYDKLNHPRALAKKLNADLQTVVRDKHVRFSAITPVEQMADKRDPVLAHLMDIRDYANDNFGIREVKILPQNIGYLNLHSFEAVNLAQEKVKSALHILSDTHAMIIDLRENRGGNPAMVQYICSFFFDRRVHLNSIYWRRGDYTEEFWTLDSIEAKKRPEVPMFILTSAKTFSAAEEMAYNLKTRKRAKIIGAKTGGGANPGYSFNIDNRFRVFIPTGRAVNPVTGKNWEGHGVEPDIKTDGGAALNKALELAIKSAKKYREKRDTEAVRNIMKLSMHISDALREGNSTDMDRYEPLIAAEIENCVKRGYTGEWAINSLAYKYISSKDLDLALVLLKTNASIYPKSANAFDSLGEIYMKKGETGKAIQNYRKSLSLDPLNENARLMLKKLETGDY